MLIYLLKNSVGENLILNDKSIGLLWSLNRSMVLLPHYLREKFVERGSITDYSLRDTESKLAIPLPRTNFMKNRSSYPGAVLWNSLPAELGRPILLGGVYMEEG